MPWPSHSCFYFSQAVRTWVTVKFAFSLAYGQNVDFVLINKCGFCFYLAVRSLLRRAHLRLLLFIDCKAVAQPRLLLFLGCVAEPKLFIGCEAVVQLQLLLFLGCDAVAVPRPCHHGPAATVAAPRQ